MIESKRIILLKANLIKDLPFFPNNKTTLNALERQSLNEILIHYLHWKTRIVPPRLRKIIIAPEVTSDERWSLLKSGINGLLEKVRNSEDIYPYHSEGAHRKGYKPLKQVRDGDFADLWEDKDQLLNTKGFHHFHLNMDIQSTGLSERTDDVLFAFVNRDTFHAVGIFNHDVFKQVDTQGKFTAEREKMWKLHEKHLTLGMSPGTVYISNPIMLSGHPTMLVKMSDIYARTIRETDPKLDDRLFINSLYDQARWPQPKKYNFEWNLEHLDLKLFDKKNNSSFVTYKGHI